MFTLAVCAVLITFGGYAVQLGAGGVAGIILLMLVSEGLSGDGDVIGSTGRKWQTLRDDVDPRDRFASAERSRRAVGRGDPDEPPRPTAHR
jgi:hypothetical protein